MNNICGIYKITSPTGKIYIGQSKNIYKRMNGYIKNHSKKQYKIHASIKKHGWFTHKFEIICECNINQLNYLEKYYIKLYDSFDSEHGLNLTSGGGCRIRFSKQSREKMSYITKIRTYSLETRKKIAESLKGIKRSEETIIKMKMAKLV